MAPRGSIFVVEAQDLRDSDAAAVLDLVAAIANVSDLDDYATVTMHGLVELIPCVDASYNEMNPDAQRVRFTALPDRDHLLDRFRPIFERLMHQNPLVRHFEDTGDTRAMMWSDFITLDELHRTELYEEMFHPLGVDSQMAMTLPAPPGIVVGFAVNTGPECFTERDRTVMNALRPHLAHAYRTIQLSDELSLVRQALQARGWTGALADTHGIVHAVTDDARELEDESGVSLQVGEPLPEPLRAPFEASVRAYDATTPAVLSRSTRLSEEAGGVAGWHVPSPIPPHVVLVQSHVDAGRQRLGDAGLSPRQVHVALELAEGGTNAAIAARLGIAEGTLRKHLERIYRTLGVSDRASAVSWIRAG